LCCGSGTGPLTPDHVVPLSLGGSNWITNST
jgi:5-methylcytosine-specific restriction endonuclease McrA